VRCTSTTGDRQNARHGRRNMPRCGFNPSRSAANALRRSDNVLRREWNVPLRPEKRGCDAEKHTASRQEHAPRADNHAWRFAEPWHVRRKAARLACHHPARRCVGTPRSSEEACLTRERCTDCPEQPTVASEDFGAPGKAGQSMNHETQSSGLSGPSGIVSTDCVVASAHAHLATRHSAMN
jgi:hypothetical protein